jgi:hypothetical protein
MAQRGYEQLITSAGVAVSLYSFTGIFLSYILAVRGLHSAL